MNSTTLKISITLIIIVFISGCIGNQNDKSVPAEIFSVENMNLEVHPGDDFYSYVNGTWLSNTPIPDDKSGLGIFDDLYEKNREDIQNIIEEVSAVKDVQDGSITQMIRDMYNSGMDTVKIDQLDTKPMEDLFVDIEGISSMEDIFVIAAELQLIGADPFFFMAPFTDFENSDFTIAYIGQAGISLPDRDYYLLTDEATLKIRQDYLNYLETIFEMLNEGPDATLENARKIMEIETRMAQHSFSNLDNRDMHKINNKHTLEELENLSPEFNWKLFLAEIGLQDLSVLNVMQPPYFEELGEMMNSVPIEDWKVFLKWKLVNSYSSYLSSRFEKQNFDFYAKTFGGMETMEPRWKRILDNTSRSMGEAIGKLYVERYFPPEAKQEMINLVENLRKSYKLRIENLSWMGAETKEEALTKLARINVKVGYPDEWRDYSELVIRPDEYLGNMFRISRFDFKYYMEKCGKPVDRNEWGMSPQQVNAYYHPGLNEIVFPAGILQPPFFNLLADDAMNYGGIGVVIAHEISHGFDDQGRNFDKDGNLNDWWTEEDAEEFKERTSVLVDQFNEYEVLDSVYINGELTLGENIADLGGAMIGYHAYQISLEGKEVPEKIDGYTGNQRFFLSFAQIWRSKTRDESLKTRIKTDVHSPEMFRVNGIVYNMTEFYAAFPDIGAENEMFIPVDQRAVIW